MRLLKHFNRSFIPATTFLATATFAALPFAAAHAQESVPTAAEAAAQLTANDRLEFPVTHFYMTRDLASVFRAIDKAVSEEITTSVVNFEVLALFFAELYRQDPRVMGPSIQFFSKYKNDLNVLPWMAAWLANTPATLAQVEKLKETGYTEPHKIITSAAQKNFRKTYPRDRLTIDALWTLYYASGNPQDAAMVIETALFDQKADDGSLVIADANTAKAIQDYATGSVIVHAAKHPQIMQLLARLSKSVPESGRDRLQQISASALALAQQAKASAGQQ